MSYTDTHKAALHALIKEAKSASETERAWALLTLAKGKSRADVAEIFEVHIDTLDRWQTAFKRKGVAGIMDQPYPGNHRKLTREQKATIKQTLVEKNPKELKLSDKRFWTTKELKELIKKEYGVVFGSDATYRKLFYSFGFSCHKPGTHDRNQRPKEAARFRVKVKKRSDNTSGWAVWYW